MSGSILVTGAGGLIGTELLPLLKAGSWVAVESRRQCDLSVPGQAAELVETVRPGTIVHLAGGTSPSRQEVYRKNVLSTVHLLEAAARLEELPYCIVLGSAAEYGDASEERITESSPPRPVTEYGRAKLAQTALAEAICETAGLPLTILRPFNLVSPRLPPSSPLGNLRDQLLRGEGRIECGRLNVVRDFVPVSAVAEAIRRLVASPAPGETLNVCSGVGIELGSILKAMAERLGVAVRTVQKPELLAIPAAPRVVGDPSRLGRVTGLRIEVTAEGLAGLLLGAA